MFVTMISRVMTILSDVIEQAKDEGRISIQVQSLSKTVETFDVLENYKVSQRLHILMSTLPVPQLFVDLFFFTYEKVKSTLYEMCTFLNIVMFFRRAHFVPQDNKIMCSQNLTISINGFLRRKIRLENKYICLSLYFYHNETKFK